MSTRKSAIAFVLALILGAAPALGVMELGYAGGPPPDVADATPDPLGVSYKVFEHYPGAWSDAEKSPSDPANEMCWAAVAANVLDWSGWGQVAGMSTADDMFGYIRSYWANQAGLPGYAWDWWFDGTIKPGKIVLPGGGNFYPTKDINNYHEVYSGTNEGMMAGIHDYLRAGCGVGIGVYGFPVGAHALTAWGVHYDPLDPSNYFGIFVTDSDDDKDQTDPPDALHYYEVYLSTMGGPPTWFLRDFYGSDYAFIQFVEALAPIPEPVTVLGVSLALCGLVRYARKRRKA